MKRFKRKKLKEKRRERKKRIQGAVDVLRHKHGVRGRGGNKKRGLKIAPESSP